MEIHPIQKVYQKITRIKYKKNHKKKNQLTAIVSSYRKPAAEMTVGNS
jgi:hypothetical protein